LRPHYPHHDPRVNAKGREGSSYDGGGCRRGGRRVRRHSFSISQGPDSTIDFLNFIIVVDFWLKNIDKGYIDFSAIKNVHAIVSPLAAPGCVLLRRSPSIEYGNDSFGA
jgi:hypothetical protein